MPYQIPFNKPANVGTEYAYMQRAVEGGHISGDGTFTRQCHKLLEEALGVPRALLTTSCTHALEIAAILLNIQPGDEVIVPSFTFVSTINAFVLRGAVPVFADIRKDTLNLDEAQLPSLITERTRAVVPVHYAGVACEMDSIMETAATHDVAVIEDNAHGLFGKYKGQWLGTFGAMATQSFHETKNFTCGEGGALLINDENYSQRAEIVREKGTNRSRFFRGEIDKYTWVDVGSSYLPSDMLAAYLYAQLEARDSIHAKRQQIWETYHTELAGWAEVHAVRQPTVPDYCDQAYHMYYLLMPSLEARTRFIAALKVESILSVFHYLPLNLSGMGMELGGSEGQCPVTEDLSDRLVRLPFFFNMTDAQLHKVIEVITKLTL